MTLARPFPRAAPWLVLALAIGAEAQATPLSTLGLGVGDCLRVTEGASLEVDISAVLGRLDVDGVVTFVDGGPLALQVSGIDVGGTFAVGSAIAAHTWPLELRLVGDTGCAVSWELLPGGALAPLPPNAITIFDARTLAVHGDGQLEMYGMDPGLTWTQLLGTALPGETVIDVAGGAAWRHGQRVVLAPTDFEADATDAVALVGPPVINGSDASWGLDAALAHEHYANAADDVPVFGEVGLLSRNVRITSPDALPVGPNDCVAAGFSGDHLEFDGAEIRVDRKATVDTANARLHFIEVSRAGRFDRMGRYPIHFHKLGDATGAEVVGVSVHESSNRGIVVHGSQNVRVRDNVVYDVVGHAYYLEQQPFMPTSGNRLEHNLAVQVHGCPADDSGNPLDVQQEDDETSSGFFFTDPRNTFVDNAVGGAFRAGFWWAATGAYDGLNLCGTAALHGGGGGSSEALDLTLFSYPSAYGPADYAAHGYETTCYGAFVGNVAHSAQVGLWAEEHKSQLVRFTDLTAYKNRRRATELKNHGFTELVGLQATDNPLTIWGATHAFHPGYRSHVLVVDSVIGGESIQRPVLSFPFGDPAIPWFGVEVYEGRLHVADTLFVGFDDTDPLRGPRAAFGRHQTFPFYSNNADNSVENAVFGPGVNPLYFDPVDFDTRSNSYGDPIAGASGFQTVALHDLTGDISGVPGAWIAATDDFVVPGQLGSPGPGVVHDSTLNAWVLDPAVWSLGQILVEWCADETTLPLPGGAQRCDPLDALGVALPARQWRLINADGDDYDVIHRVVFADPAECAAPPCDDAVDAAHHAPLGNKNIQAANVRIPGRTQIHFGDRFGNLLVPGAADFAHVQAMHVRLRQTQPGAEALVDVVVPGPPSCVVRYDDLLGQTCIPMTPVGGPPASPDEWSADPSGILSLRLEHVADEQSVLMVFDPAAICPC